MGCFVCRLILLFKIHMLFTQLYYFSIYCFAKSDNIYWGCVCHIYQLIHFLFYNFIALYICFIVDFNFIIKSLWFALPKTSKLTLVYVEVYLNENLCLLIFVIDIVQQYSTGFTRITLQFNKLHYRSYKKISLIIRRMISKQ